jgi:hypothetical protein
MDYDDRQGEAGDDDGGVRGNSGRLVHDGH